jgi:MFS family permease
MKLFYGWVIVGVGMVVTCMGLGTMMSLGIFLQPMAETMGWSRAGISTAATLNFLAMGFGSFAWGTLSDRFGTRAVVLCGGVLLGLGLTLASQATGLVAFQLLFGILVGLAAGSFYAPMIATTTRWFTAHRSLAVAMVSAGLAMGSLFVAPLARALISAYDWRTAMFALGCGAWAIVIPVALLLRPPPAPARTASSASGAEEFTVAQALRTPQFAAIALTHFACCAAHSGPIFHMVTYAIDCGVSPMAAATVFGTAGLAALGGRVVCGLVADRVGARLVLLVGLTIQAVAFSLYLAVHDVWTFYALASLFGFSYGGVMPLYAILVREYFGARIMGTMFGAVAMVSTLGMAIGPWGGGWLFDAFGGYFWLYAGSFGIGVGAVAIALTTRPPRPVPAMLAGAGAAHGA